MKNYLNQYKSFLIFLIKFSLSYLLLMLAYHYYLNHFNNQATDGITTMVGHHTKQFLQIFSINLELEENLANHCINLKYNNQILGRLIEGCNAVSIIILFLSFVFSFTGAFLKTILFIATGTVCIYIFNIIRIGILFYLMFKFPNYLDLLHQIVFPLVIYGFVFILWVLWVTKFSIYAKKNLEQ